jgi:hypothetical protein
MARTGGGAGEWVGRCARVLAALAVLLPSPGLAIDFVAVTFNSGTTTALPHNADQTDGYTSSEANISDDWYGNGLAWQEAVDAAQIYFSGLRPEIVAFQEIFYSGECPGIPTQYHPGFVCETWQPGDPTVAEIVLGPDYQVACNLGKPDKCLAVRKDFGLFQGCSGNLCLDGLDGVSVPGCGGGSRVGRGAVDLASGGTLTLVNVHGTSGIADADQDCRVAQFSQIFEDLDGEPAANGDLNLVMADFNVDPARWIGFDPSANLLEFHAPVAGGGVFAYLSEVGFEAPPTYFDLFNLDHILSDEFTGSCTTPGIATEPPVWGTVYFDHVPIVCAVPEPGSGSMLFAGIGWLAWTGARRRLARRRSH